MTILLLVIAWILGVVAGVAAASIYYRTLVRTSYNRGWTAALTRREN